MSTTIDFKNALIKIEKKNRKGGEKSCIKKSKVKTNS